MNTFQAGKNRVSYHSDGIQLVADFYLPHDYSEGKVYPAVVVTRPGSGVKEQTAGVYAEALSQHGFATLAFDARGYGESEGHQSVENPFNICEDSKNSVSFLSTLPCVDKDNIFGVGICMGAGYAAYAAALDARVKAVGMISPYLNAAQQNIDAAGGIDMVRQTLLPMTAKARQHYFETGEDMLMQPVPETEAQAEQPGTLPIQIGMMGYYLPGQAGGYANWKNGLSLYNFESLISFSAFHVLPLLKQVPVFMALGSEAYTVDNSREFYDALTGEKAMAFIEGASHFDLYWKPEHVTPIAEKMAAFFKEAR